jgi:4-hydroxy-4-methyl-2-oxoglutarate aldolase
LAIIVRDIDRPDKALINEFRNLAVATIHESIGKETSNVMDQAIKPIERGMKLLGPALTVDSFPADNSTVHFAMTLCKKGDVLVVNGHGMLGVMFGSQMCFQCKVAGVSGIIVDGAIRDSEEIRKMNFPCFTKYISPLGSNKATVGSINIPIQCGGVIVTPGDLILGDDDGVVVVPRKSLSEVLVRAKERTEKEEKTKELLLKGETSVQLNHFENLLKSSKEIERLEQ